MYCNSAHSLVPEVITLSDSDDEDDSMREVQKAAATSATASVSIVHERPLSPSAFLFPSQQTSLSCRTPLANCSATTECALGMNDIALRSSHLRSSKRLAQDHQDVVAAKRSAVADNSQRRPLQQSAQIVPSVRPTFAYDVVSSTPSTSNSRLRQPSVQDHATNGEPNRNIRASMMVRGHSAVPYSQQNSRPVSQQRYKTAEPQNSCSSQVQRNKLLASSQPILRQQPTAQRRTTPINSASSWHPVTQRTTTLNSYCYESFDPKAPPFEAQTFSARFKCSYGRCRKILSNNVSLMFHVWTHLMCGSPSEAGGDSKNYLETSSICPQCLHAFPTPRDMQLHYSNVHGDHPSEVTCKICELTVDPAVHTSLHGDDDAPYHCRKCRYRTSIRTHLLDHFVRFHSNTRSLLCPFCLSSFSVGSNSSNSSVVTCTQFVGHMRQHRTIKNIRCCCCALKFVRQFDRKAHKKDHTKKNPKWISKPYTKHQRRKGRKVWPASDSHRCLECAEVVDDLQEHTRQIRTCARCEYSTACDDEYMHHKGVQCTKRRSGFTRSRLLRCCVICTKCGRKSADPESIFPHLMKCSEGSAIVHDADREPIDERAAAREQQEIEHFALRERDLLADDGWLPAAAKAEREQNLPDSIKRVNVMLNSITDYEHFLEASKRKLACVEEEVLAEELNDVLLCMDGFDPEIA